MVICKMKQCQPRITSPIDSTLGFDSPWLSWTLSPHPENASLHFLC